MIWIIGLLAALWLIPALWLAGIVAAFHLRFDLRWRKLQHREARARRLGAQARQGWRQAHVLTKVRGGDAPGELGPGRVERRRRQDCALELQQGET